MCIENAVIDAEKNVWYKDPERYQRESREE
jgi:hypothetical protein